ncbi:TrkH family potassium uptake protein [Glycomyces buryatensis]|uniref:TrkH family potassium uptake protein n=1 Tax=Glycomyces buryatensis TaxID=2570927 RepID=A0A4S8QDE2_9ACTN|nr:potassium transporter TrkG [Glycomyces buryatensis]THV42388.1 TrkH family potassium uptake protein [Glycomyces buryatensis]
MSKLFARIARHPIRLVPITFVVVILAAGGLLMLPVAQADPGSTHWVDAFFTSTSAITVTGLVTLDTPVHWTMFGEGVIMVAMQVGGLGIMTSAAFLGLLVSKKLGLRSRLIAQAELHTSVSLGDLRGVILRAFVVAGLVELTVAVILTLRFHFHYGMPTGEAMWQGLFHGVSSFNNGGFSLFSDSLMGFVNDPWVIGPVAAASIIGSLGMPVIFELTRRGWGRRKWTLHTKMTLAGTSILFAGGMVVFLAFEWSNPATLGPMGWHEKLWPAFFQSAMLRTTGFNSIDVGAMQEHSLLTSIVLMFIGGGSASTSGGIKVTTFFVLLWVIWSEVRGEPDASAFRTRLSVAVIRQSLTIALIYVAANAAAIVTMQMFEPQFALHEIMFEVTSALATVGQSTGITADLSTPSRLLIVFLMFVGRIGPVLLATSLAMRTRQRLYRYPEGRPLVG